MKRVYGAFLGVFGVAIASIFALSRVMERIEARAENQPLVDTTCIFCAIVSKQQPGTSRIIYEDEQIVAFEDIKPAARLHLQVIPKRHIKSTGALGAADLELVRSMRRVGTQLVQARYAAGVDSARFGFHRPPFYSHLGHCLTPPFMKVGHLHMHTIAGPWTGCFKPLKYLSIAPWWLSADSLIRDLEEKAKHGV